MDTRTFPQNSGPFIEKVDLLFERVGCPHLPHPPLATGQYTYNNHRVYNMYIETIVRHLQMYVCCSRALQVNEGPPLDCKRYAYS